MSIELIELVLRKKNPNVPYARILKDARDAAAVSAGLCTAHGCKSAPMPNYRRCAVHHKQRQQRNRARWLASPRKAVSEQKKLMRIVAKERGLCNIFGCGAPAVKYEKCLTHMSSAQLNQIAPRVRGRSGAQGDLKGEDMTWTTLPEYRAVWSHLHCIKTSHLTKNATYKDMPFFADWDSRQGGRILNGARWIIDNLGLKPGPDFELHIINRSIGFMPGNLAWVPRRGHKQEEEITRLLIENQKLKARIRELENSLQFPLDRKAGSGV